MTRSSRMFWALFSPRSNSLRTTVISVSSSAFSIRMLTMRSASSPNAHRRFVVAGGHGLEIVGAVVVRGAVPLRAVVGQFLLDVAVVGRADEVHMLEQMRHAGLAVSFKARADQVRHVDRDFRVRRIGEQQDAQAVGIVVFGEAAEARLLLDTARQGLRKRRTGHRQHDGERKNFHAHESLPYGGV